jgi:hypothetical protein
MPKQISTESILATGPASLTPALSKQRSRGKPLKGLKRARQTMSTGLKRGVNESEDSVNPLNKSREHPRFGSSLNKLLPSRRYLENRYARIFGELPFQFSNEAPALIWNLSLPAWPQT